MARLRAVCYAARDGASYAFAMSLFFMLATFLALFFAMLPFMPPAAISADLRCRLPYIDAIACFHDMLMSDYFHACQYALIIATLMLCFFDATCRAIRHGATEYYAEMRHVI